MLPENLIHGGLKGSWCVGQFEWHDQELKVPKVTSEICLVDILLSHTDLMIPKSQIYLGEVLSSMELINDVVHPWNRVFVLDCFLIEHPIINAHSHGPVFFLHQDNRRCKGTKTRSYESHIKQFLDGSLNLILIDVWMLVGCDHYEL